MIINLSHCFNRYNFEIHIFLPIQLSQCRPNGNTPNPFDHGAGNAISHMGRLLFLFMDKALAAFWEENISFGVA